MKEENIKKYFWDVDFDSLDIKKYKQFVLERILEFGDENAIKWAMGNFSKDDFLETLKKSRRISKLSVNYWNLILSK